MTKNLVYLISSIAENLMFQHLSYGCGEYEEVPSIQGIDKVIKELEKEIEPLIDE